MGGSSRWTVVAIVLHHRTHSLIQSEQQITQSEPAADPTMYIKIEKNMQENNGHTRFALTQKKGS